VCFLFVTDYANGLSNTLVNKTQKCCKWNGLPTIHSFRLIASISIVGGRCNFPNVKMGSQYYKGWESLI